MKRNQRIFIQSERDDKSTDDILWWLSYLAPCANVNCIWNDHSIKKLSLSIDNAQGTKLTIDNQTITSKDYFWYRRGRFLNGFIKPISEQPKEFNQLIEDSSRYSYKPFFRSISNWRFSRKIGSFSNNAITKIDILQSALYHGLAIPPTLITGSKKELIAFLETNESVLTKPLNNPFTGYEMDSDMSLNVVIKTSIIKKDSISEKTPPNFALSLFQQYIHKKIEIRSFVLKDKVYSMAIFSQNNEKTKIDYRNYDRQRPNRNVPFKLPQVIEKKLVELAKSLGLETGSADIILTPDNRYVFLEINPVGQFQWLSRNCNYGLEKKIAHELLINL